MRSCATAVLARYVLENCRVTTTASKVDNGQEVKPEGKQSANPAPVEHFKVLTYNIHRAIGLDRRFRPERIVEVLKHHDADIVLLQEVDEGVPRSREVNLARELATAAGYPHFAFGHNVTLRKGKYGNATLSRWPIACERNIDLTIDWRKRRGCQHTRIELPRGGRRKPRTLEVFNLHLGLSAVERSKQVAHLLGSTELADLDPSALCLVGGDFNDWRSLLVGQLTGEPGFRCAVPGAGTGPCLRTYPSFMPRGALDRAYLRGDLELCSIHTSRLAVARVASDHLPLVVELAIAGDD